MALGKLEELKETEEVLQKDETTVSKEATASKETTASCKTIGEAIQEQEKKIAVERAKKVEELFEFIKNLYLDNSELVYMRLRIADITSKGIFPQKVIEFFDRKAKNLNAEDNSTKNNKEKKLTIKVNYPKENNFVDFEGNDFDSFVSKMADQGMQVLFDSEDIDLHDDEHVRRLYLCILPADRTLGEYYVSKVFGENPDKIDSDTFYDMISEDNVYNPEDSEDM